MPAIADRAPTLLGADDDAQVSLFSFVEGRPAADETPDLHRRAGLLLRRFHDVEPAVRLDGYLSASLRERFDQWVGRARRGVLDADEIDVVAGWLDRAEGLAEPLGVPCHRDWQTRNWLIDDDRRAVGDRLRACPRRAVVRGRRPAVVAGVARPAGPGRGVPRRVRPPAGRRRPAVVRHQLGALAPDDDRVVRRARRSAVPRRGSRPPPIDVRRLNAARLPTCDP